MRFRVLHVVAILACTLLAAGCFEVDSAREQVICFRAGSPLLRDDATKATTDNFTKDGETFVVFGEKVTATDTHDLVFDGVTVSHSYEGGVTDKWGYSPAQSWAWTSQSDRYDFVAVSPGNMGTTNEQAVGNLSVSTHYDYLTGAPSGGDKEDILAATYRRTGLEWNRRFDRVPLSFSHMGSAVAVTVINSSSSTNVIVTSIYYKNLVVSADAKVTLDNYGRTVLRWTNLTPSNAVVRKLTKEKSTFIGYGSEYTGEYQIMIPQDLSLYGAQLYLTYKKGESLEEITTDPIALSDIHRADGSAITSWEIGYKYTYSVYMRLDGGLLVTVTTTPWDEPVQAETPGILI